ncbi:tripartite motif-containing protein 16 [Triplophysa rosa]|uniref:Tripartite motif-containing protein 16-like n=1 Tax=Triplophysa rosa TaxID=992332 RepID=A0A9W7WCA8_TRIRA|nr:tripartite motif-containing protein 16 [Triplophysa rosa]KAI7793965.1 putative tripartite motif-containing protein 16-like [Triplophysa rosa]
MEREPRPPVCSGCLRDPQINFCPQCEQTSTSGTDPDQAESLERADPDQSVASVVERLERTDLQTDEGADVECDACAVRQVKVMKSCLGRLASRCDAHLETHADLRTRETQTCSRHDRPLEEYCRFDQMRVCFLCILDEHKGHDAVSVASGRAEKRTQLEETVKKVTDREAELNDVKKAADILMNLSEATEEAGERIFTELTDFIQSSHTEAMTLIQNHMRAEMNRIHRHVDGLEEKISELKSEHSEPRRLSDTEHHVSYLQRDDFSSRTINPQFSFGEVIKSLSSLTQQIRDIWTLEIRRISSAVKRDQILLPSEPKTREDFLQFLVPLSLDPNTAHRNLSLTDQNRTVVCSTESQPYPEHPERFQWWAQVLTSEGLTGRCYWEVIWTGLYGVDVAVAYKDIKRTGDRDDSGFGYNRYSWSLDCSEFRCALVHDNTETAMTGAVSHRIGVYLDHRAGLLSFYSITDTMTLLHRVHNHFTQPLYPGFGLFQGSSLILSGPEFIAMPQKSQMKK